MCIFIQKIFRFVSFRIQYSNEFLDRIGHVPDDVDEAHDISTFN